LPAYRIQVILWQLDTWRCELQFSAQIRLRLYQGFELVSDEMPETGLDALKQANAWKTAVCQKTAKPA
jgi:hypothetical protein